MIVDSLLTALFSFLLKLVLWLLGVIVSIVVYPIQAIVVFAFPDLGNFLSTAVNYLVNDLCPMISYIKDIILGILCIPNALWVILIDILAFRVAAVPAIRFIKTAINAWKIKSGNIKLD